MMHALFVCDTKRDSVLAFFSPHVVQLWAEVCARGWAQHTRHDTRQSRWCGNPEPRIRKCKEGRSCSTWSGHGSMLYSCCWGRHRTKLPVSYNGMPMEIQMLSTLCHIWHCTMSPCDTSVFFTMIWTNPEVQQLLMVLPGLPFRPILPDATSLSRPSDLTYFTGICYITSLVMHPCVIHVIHPSLPRWCPVPCSQGRRGRESATLACVVY